MADTPLPPDALDGLLAAQGWRVAWRLETRRRYESDVADPRYERWRRGEPLVYEPDRPWYRHVQQHIAAGRRIERVRIVDNPLTPGQHYLLDTASLNTQAGEDIRIMPRYRAALLALPDTDFWLLDEGEDPTVATLHFDHADRWHGITVSRTPDDVAAARSWRAVAWPSSASCTARQRSR